MKHNFEISYTQQGDYLLPDLRLPRYRGLKQGSPPPVMAVWEPWPFSA